MLSSIPVLHSYAAAAHTIYLDFDGEVVPPLPGKLPEIHALPFDIDGVRYDPAGAPAFSSDELSRITSIWERMAEDFRPFDVDVTTQDPSIAVPGIFSQPGVALRVVFTSKIDAGSSIKAQAIGELSHGLAELGSWTAALDIPAWVFSTHPIGAGEIGSHEVGHALGLHHHGDASKTGLSGEYRGPHGYGVTRWSPIMGQGNDLTQWSKAEYPQATRDQDDLGQIAAQLGRRPDESNRRLGMSGDFLVHQEGIIGSSGDSDIYSFEISEPGTLVAIDAAPWHNGPNLDIGLSLFGLTTGRLFGPNDESINPIDQLGASFRMPLDAGTYYLTVQGTGKSATGNDPGYTDYGSLGYYRLSGSIGSVPSLRGDINHDGMLSAADIDALVAAVRESSAGKANGDPDSDLNQDNLLDQSDIDYLVQQTLRTEYGDFTLDGRVDLDDFLQLAAHFGKSDQGWANGDANGDNRIDFLDFVLLSQTFGFEASLQTDAFASSRQ